MHSKSSAARPYNDPSTLPIRLGLTQIASDDGFFPVLLRGEFYLLEDWQGEKTSWMGKSGQVVVVCPVPKALINLSFFVIPVERAGQTPLQLLLKQGAATVFDQQIVEPERIEVSLSLIEGQNPISCQTVGKLLSPFEMSGQGDARKLSFAWQKFTVVALS